MLPLLLSVAAWSADGDLPEPPDETKATTELWIGSLSVPGIRKVPLLGKVEFRTDTHLLAAVVWLDENRFRITQQTCQVKFPKSMGAQITMPDAASRAVQPASYDWSSDDNKQWTAGPWPSGWTEDDHDQDGFPGITFGVEAPFCGGDLYVSSAAEQTAKGRRLPDGDLQASIDVHVSQTILGARGPCLNLMARDTTDWMHGQFRLRTVQGPLLEQVLGDANLAASGSNLSELCPKVPDSAWPDPWENATTR